MNIHTHTLCGEATVKSTRVAALFKTHTHQLNLPASIVNTRHLPVCECDVVARTHAGGLTPLAVLTAW